MGIRMTMFFTFLLLLAACSDQIHGRRKREQTPLPPHNDAPETLVFLLGGQSNMAGQSPTPTGLGEQLKEVQNVEIYCARPYDFATNTDQWIPGRRPKWKALSTCGANDGMIGPEVAFGLKLGTSLPDKKILLIKFAHGGTSLFCEWQPLQRSRAYLEQNGDQLCPAYINSISYKSPDYLWAYRRFQVTVNDALSEIKPGTQWTWGGMLWVQGEADADGRDGFGYLAKSYQANLQHFISTIRTEIKTPQLKFVAAKIKCGYQSSPWGENPTKMVRDAMETTASLDHDVATIETWDLSMQEITGDCCHFDGHSMLTIGERFASAFGIGTDTMRFPPPRDRDCKNQYPTTPP